MYIMTQDRKGLINLDNVITIVKEETLNQGKTQYWADTMTNDTIKLGEYNNMPEHENLIEKIAKTIGATDVFCMPEE